MSRWMKAGQMENEKKNEGESKLGWEMSGDFCVLQNQFIAVYPYSSSSHQPLALTRNLTPTQEKHNSNSKTHLIFLTLPLTSYTFSFSHCSQMSLVPFRPQPCFHVVLCELINLPLLSYRCHTFSFPSFNFISHAILFVLSPSSVPFSSCFPILSLSLLFLNSFFQPCSHFLKSTSPIFYLFHVSVYTPNNIAGLLHVTLCQIGPIKSFSDYMTSILRSVRMCDVECLVSRSGMTDIEKNASRHIICHSSFSHSTGTVFWGF